MKRALFVLAAASAAILGLGAAPTLAQNRVFVSGLGSDANPCSLPAPCRSFQHAHDTVNAGGEIAVLDTAGYGALTITKAISIVNPGGVEAGIATSPGGNAITINAGASDVVSLRGLTLEGTGSAATGIAFTTGQSLTIENCVVRNFVGSGIAIAPTASGVLRIAVTNTVVADNGGHGIYIQPGGTNTGTVKAIFNRVEVYNSAQEGIGLFGNHNPNIFIVAIAVDSVAGNNNSTSGHAGFYALGAASFYIFRSTAFGNFDGAFADGAFIQVSQSNLEGNGTPWLATNTATLNSYGDDYTGGLAVPGFTIGKN